MFTILYLVVKQLNKTLLPSSSNVLTIIACTWYTVLSYQVLYTVLSYHPPHSLVSAIMFSLEVNTNILLYTVVNLCKQIKVYKKSILCI